LLTNEPYCKVLAYYISLFVCCDTLVNLWCFNCALEMKLLLSSLTQSCFTPWITTFDLSKTCFLKSLSSLQHF